MLENRTYFDGTKSFDLTCVEKLGILQAAEFTRFATEHKIPGLERCGITVPDLMPLSGKSGGWLANGLVQ